MAKTLIVSGESERVPFLRGILTRSLQDAGLGFEEAYLVASKVRDELREVVEITNDELRERTVKHLAPLGNHLTERYLRPEIPTILVRGSNGDVTPFSRGRQRLRLEACGLTATEAVEFAGAIQERLTNQAVREIGSMDLRRMTHKRLVEKHGPGAAHSYLVWEEFLDAGVPLIVLLGGATGCGKSTVASELAHQLDIVRTQPTDMLREVMRMMIPEGLMPALHTSTFTAHRELPLTTGSAEDSEARLANGFLTQATMITFGCKAVVQRALSERVSLILEGIHVIPEWMLKTSKESKGGIVAPVMLAVLRRDSLRKRLLGRGREATGRRAKRYLENFEEIWSLQSFLLSEADRYGIPIVPNSNREQVVHRVLGSVMRVLSQRFEGSPDRVLR